VVEVIAEIEGKKQGNALQELQHPQYGTIVEANSNQSYSLRLTNNTEEIMGAKFWIDGQLKGSTTTLRQQKPKVLKALSLSKDVIHESKPSEECGVIRVSFYPVEMKETKKRPETQETSTKRAGPKYHISSNNPAETISIRYFPKESLAQLGLSVSSAPTTPLAQSTSKPAANPKKRHKKSAEPVSTNNNNNNNHNNMSQNNPEQFQMEMSALYSTNQPDAHDPRYIWISVRNMESKSVAMSYFLILKNTPLKYLQQSYSVQHGVPPPTFILNGTPLPIECTPEQLGLKDGVALQVSFHAMSGTGLGESDTTLILRVRYKQTSLKFKINKDDSMSKLMETFCRKKNVDLNAVAFMFDGFPIQASATAKSLHLENEDLIEVLAKEVAEKQIRTKHESSIKQQQYSPPPPSHVMTYPFPTNATTAAYLQAMQTQPGAAPYMFYRHPDVYQENHE